MTVTTSEPVTLEPRIAHPTFLVEGAGPALQALARAVLGAGVPRRTLELVDMRVSQINGCGSCLLGHARMARRAGESDDRIAVLAGWRDAPFFTAGERAALALAEAVTRIGDLPDPVPDDIWDEAARHYDEQSLGALVLAISMINLWNRLNVATRQVAGAVEW
ncbi:carboxymuconolactone decarboxylase family protein [Pseudonocardia zijingensis]|uniref:Carboxymuconolactone decarboxylase family protein n=1 Tax=Pseudonocardia zijingensis TaxID=153376 RepID=A0ABP4AXT9_9PSEU